MEKTSDRVSGAFKSGYIGLIGRTNVGKSTLINRILKNNVLITSDKVQTTRNRVNCIYNRSDAQAIFVDCPGFFKPRNLLGEKLNKIVYGVIEDVDVISVVVDLAGGIGAGDFYVFERIKGKRQPKILVLNKIDLLGDRQIKNLSKESFLISKEYDFFNAVVLLSAKTGENVPDFLESVITNLSAGPKYFPDDVITDMPLNKMIAEIVREKLVDNLYEELPHSVNVEVDSIEKTETAQGEPLSRIECSIFIEKRSHKAIIIGKSGTMLKKIGELSRREIENLIGNRVYLKLWVKVMENWTRNEHYLDRMGYRG
ncbi:MAG: GTPase Era [Actinobacteria bacterium]|nr:GTPase Era [Actinomycetota bacterium]